MCSLLCGYVNNVNNVNNVNKVHNVVTVSEVIHGIRRQCNLIGSCILYSWLHKPKMQFHWNVVVHVLWTYQLQVRGWLFGRQNLPRVWSA